MKGQTKPGQTLHSETHGLMLDTCVANQYIARHMCIVVTSGYMVAGCVANQCIARHMCLICSTGPEGSLGLGPPTTWQSFCTMAWYPFALQALGAMPCDTT